MEKIRAQIIMDELKVSHDFCMDKLGEVVFDKEYPQHLYLIALCASVIEMTACVVSLIEKQLTIGVPIITRSILEAYVDIINLSSDPDYANYMRVANIKEILKLKEEKGQEGNPFLEGIINSEEIAQAKAEMSEELASFKEKGVMPLSHYKRFEMAGLLHEYRSIYNMLCTHSHNDIRALLDRHIEIDGDDFKVISYPDKPLDRMEHYLVLLVDIILDSSYRVHRALKSPALQALEEKNKDWKEYANQID